MTLRATGTHVSMVRRFLADNWLELVLQTLTLGFGWLIWLAIASTKGQTPAKQLTGIYIHAYDSGAIASAGRVWMREIVGKYAVPVFIAIASVFQTGAPAAFLAGNVFFLLGAATVLFNEDRRALWDYIAGTQVRYHKYGVAAPPDPNLTLANSRAAQRLQQIDSLKSRGLITDEEYEAKRAEILASF